MQAFKVSRKGGWENWQDPASGEWLRSCTLLTTEANALVRAIHHRMPVMLPEAFHRAWLGEATDGDLKAMLVPFDAKQMADWEVSPPSQLAPPQRAGTGRDVIRVAKPPPTPWTFRIPPESIRVELPFRGFGAGV